MDLLRQRSLGVEARGGYAFLSDSGTPGAEIDFAALDHRARVIAAVLQQADAAGRPVLLVYPAGLEFIAAFFGCLYAGSIAVPVYPPRSSRSLPRVRAVAEDARPHAVLTSAALLRRVEEARSAIPALQASTCIATESLPSEMAREWNEPDIDEDSVAFLQYTSGSTASPRGVVLRHRNLLHNEECIRAAFGQSADSVVVSWLPLYHDMGLIGGVLQPLYVGARCILMSPVSFLQKPSRWLEAISRYRATTSGGPSFAYDLCVRKIAERDRAELDLSSWALAFNGAEPVRAETLERFALAFEPCGFRREAFYPCYGLAEATLFVAGRDRAAPLRAERFVASDLETGRAQAADGLDVPVRSLVGCGSAWGGQQVIVADSETRSPCPPGRVGEIWVAGPSVASGYWRQPEETERTFGARLVDSKEQPFLRTGDLGFLWEGELFVTGRVKDLVIIHGRNLAPHDIELTVETSHPAFRQGCGAAFSVDVEGEERLVVVQEVEPRAQARIDSKAAAAAVRRALAEEHAVQVHEVVLLEAGGVPKTSSGKVQRRACRQAYLDHALAAVARSVLPAAGAGRPGAGPECSGLLDLGGEERAAALARLLRERVAGLVGGALPEAAEELPLAGLGLDSLAMAELRNALEADLGLELPLPELFEAPSLNELAWLLAGRLAGPDGEREIEALVPGETGSERPLTPGQRDLWLLDRRAPDSGVCNIGGAVRLAKLLDAAALERALAALARRHPALRTTALVRDGEPWQRVQPRLDPSLDVVDAGAWSEEELRQRLGPWLRAPFDLEKGPLVRAGLWSRPAGAVLSLAIHHLVADLWSLTVLARDLGVLYRREAGEAVDLPPLELSPLDVFHWQERRQAGAEGERLRQYWRRQLGPALPVCELPADRPRPPVPDWSGAAVSLRLHAEVADRLRELGRAQGATLYMVLLAAFQTLLHRQAGQEDLVVGSPTAGRDLARSAPLVGCFVNLVALRAELSGDPPFTGLLDRVRRSALDAFAHQDHPWPLLAMEMQPQGGGGRPPLLQAVLALQRAHLEGLSGLAACALGADGAALDLGGLRAESVGLERAVAQFDLSAVAAELDGGLAVSLEYATSLFDASTVARLAGQLQLLLGEVAADPSRAIGDLPLLREEELLQLLAWNETVADLPVDVPLHRRVEERAAAHPRALAVDDGAERLAYGELEERAGRLAVRLARLGAGPEAVVALCLPRSAALVTAQLAVLKTGGAFLPLDPAHPDERLAMLLEDSGARVLLTWGPRTGLRLPAGCASVDLAEALRAEEGLCPAAPVSPAGKAYVIYTSGSTGRPKGVEVPHAGLLNLVGWHLRTYGVTGDDRVALVASPAFDASLWEIWPCLAAGASLHVPGDEVRASPAVLVRWLAERSITLCFLPTPLAEAVLAEPWPGPAALRVLLTGGDRLARRPPAETAFRLVNHYGPTEAAVVATAAEIGAEGGGLPPIGRPIANVAAWVLDARLRPVAPGRAGELWIGGAGLARGYLGRPDLTAERFLPHPFTAEPGERLYRTGDRVRHRPDGSLDFLGRLDQQVKIRGVRIEPGEVEAAVASHPGVREAMVLARENRPGEARLVAYVTAIEGQIPPEAELRSWLRARLPEAMVPSAFVALAAWPLTSSGKVDRSALPAPAAAQTPGEPPATPMEEALGAIWSDVLGIGSVGRHDDFFALGGHSLLAVRLLWRVREVAGVDLPLSAVFEDPCLASLARRIEAELRSSPVPAPPAIGRAPREGDLPLSFAQERLWFLDRLDPGSPAYNIPAALRLAGPLDASALARALAAVVNRHEALRTAFQDRDEGGVQEIAGAAPLDLPCCDLAGLPAAGREAESWRLAEAEALRRFDLRRPPLARVCLLRLAQEDHLLLISMHHIAADGASMAVLGRELEPLYAAFAAGRPSPLPELPLQYADYAVWQRRWLQGERLAALVEVWRRLLSGAPRTLDLPADRPRPAVARQRGSAVPVPLAPGLAGELRTLGQRSGATLFMTLLAAFGALLGRLAGEEDLLVGSPVANRERPETAGLIGCFVNLLPLRNDLTGDPSFSELLLRVRRMAIEAYAHRDLPFEKMVEALTPVRDPGRPPLVQAVLALDTEPSALRLPGLVVEPVEVERGTAKFDLTLSLSGGADGLAGALEYDSDLFDRATARRMAGWLANLLAAGAAVPQARLSGLPLLGAAECDQVLARWSTGPALPVPAAAVHELVLEQAARTPDALALAAGELRMTYGELVLRAGLLARRLRRLGVGPERVVAVLAESGPDRVAGQLAVLLAGGAYLPLDPDYPRERLAWLIQDARAVAVLVQEKLAPDLPASEAVPVPFGMTAPAPGGGGRIPSAPVDADSPAYVIYTSGSTGLPKGVVVPHRGFANLVAWVREDHGVTAADRATQLASPGFDASVLEVWPALCSGASVHWPESQELKTSPAWLVEWLVRERITLAFAPTPLAEAILSEVSEDELERLPLRSLWTGGDRLRRGPGRVFAWSLANHYGPTENSVVTTWTVAAPGEAVPPIGRPVANHRVYVLDRWGAPVPGLVPGELHAGGAGLARGYLGRPDLTAERFVPDPFAQQPGERLYRTGDSVRFRPDGDLDFLGRIDAQVKIRGYRIEPGEVEAALAGCPGVREAAVAARGGAGGILLVAYVVAERPGAVPEAELRRHLRERLPEFMIPAVVMELPALPRTAHGKLDRRALPAPERTSEPPRTPLEELLASLWCEVLEVERVGVHDDFFALGGHSLMATRLVARVREALGVEIELRSLFGAPTVAGFAERVQDRLASSGWARRPAPPLTPGPRDGEVPLSFSQERLWLLSQLDAKGSAYNVFGVVDLRGTLHPQVLSATLGCIVARHESLRTTFSSVRGRPVQVIAPLGEWTLPRIDLDGLPAPAREAEARRLERGQDTFSFDFARGPLFVAVLLRLSASEHRLLLTLHHIVSDGWSMGVLVREAAALYPALLAGGPSPLLPLPIQYADFARWQRQWLQGEVLDGHLAYWRRHLGDPPPGLELPADRPRPPVPSFRGARCDARFAPALDAALKRLCAQMGVTRFMALLTAYYVLLHRYTGESDLCAGTFIANRNRTETEGLIGFFVNNLALRADLGGRPTWRRLAGDVREVTLGAYAHQDLPFEKLLADLKIERSLSRTPLFRVMCVLQNMPGSALRLPGLEVVQRPGELDHANFDLTLWLEEKEELEASLEYSLDLFDRSTAERMLGHFFSLLSAAVGDPDGRISDLPLLTEPERRQLSEWNDTAASWPGARSLTGLIEAQARRHPGRAAVVGERHGLTYGELNEAADCLARHLSARGVGPEVLVGLCVERSPEMIVALLGILKAGGAYLPLDPRYPRERLSLLLEDAPVLLVLTQEKLLPALPPLGIPAVCLDRDWAGIASAGAPDPPDPADERCLAYLIYTSGSTGRPKAVMVDQGSLLNHTLSAAAAYGLNPADRVLQFASISFDASAEEIYPTLVCGATLVLRSEEMLRTPAAFLDSCREREITVLDLPTAYWHTLGAALASGGLEVPACVRLVIIGGEKAVAERLADWCRRVPPSVRLFNTYGPTEATVVATRAHLAGPAPGEAPIGMPIHNVQAHVLDADGQPAPVGLPGELCIGGAGLARGYLGRPDLTAERFIPDAWGGVAGCRVYRTGDLAVRRADSALDFVGRNDEQVKIRGFRIELGEVEAHLSRAPGVGEALVVAREDEPGVRRLVGYVVPAAGCAVTTSALRAFLKDRLPDYMLPSAFVEIESVPRNHTGKVDRAALPPPERRLELGSGFVAPRTLAEEMLAGIWAEVLGLDAVGVQDDFFDLGGYSLLATQIVARVRESLDVELPLATFFEAPTIAEQALRVESAIGWVVPPIERVPRDSGLPLSFAQERIWFLAQLRPDDTSYHVPRALRLTGDLRLDALAHAYSALIERHEILRTTFPTVAGRPVQRIHPPAPFHLPLVDLRALARVADSEVERWVLELGRRLFDLARGPLLRAAVLRLPDGSHVLVQVEHHLVHDGWAEGVLLRDLLELYTAFVEERPAALPDLPVQFADFAAWQRNWLQGEVLETQLSFWKRQLAGAPALLGLPTDRPRPAVRSGLGVEEVRRLPMGFLESVRGLSRRAGATLFMVMLAAFKAVLYRYTGESDLVAGTFIANRRHHEAEGLLGMILNTLPLRTRLDGQWSFRELAAAVREVCLAAYAHQDLPFDRLVEAVQPPRSLSHTPIFQVTFAFHDAPRPDAELPGVHIDFLESHNRSSKFDMLLIAVPAHDELILLWEYSTELFDASTIERMRGHFLRVLDGATADESGRISEMRLLSPAEEHQLRFEGGGARPAAEGLAHERFATHARHRPERTALAFRDVRLGYGELDRRVRRLTRRLRTLGVGPEVLVGVFAERSPELVVALLAVLKAGGAYLPLDPAYPRERLAMILEDAGAAALLTTSSLAGELPAIAAALVLLDSEMGEGDEDVGVEATVEPANLAYVIYTSGSTGRPKGVQVPHGALANFLSSMQRRPGFTPEDRLLAVTSVSFDIAGLELLLPLVSGGEVRLADAAEGADGSLLLARLTDCGATVLQATPATWRMLIDAGWQGGDGLRVLCGGEAMPPDLARQLLAREGEVWNLYGPTETTIWSAATRVDGGAVRIGGPVDRTRLLVVDGSFELAPLGVAGELLIGGAGVTRGYLGRPDLTAERYLPDPFGTQPGARLYRTGDLVRYLPDGRLEFLGRLDHQVKVRGFRIEPGEIEAALASHAAVEAAVVTAREDRPGDRRLVAYVVGAGEAPEASDLRAHLRATLPEYMVPSNFVALEALPLTPNGKVDRKALPAPEAPRVEREGGVAPRNPIEEAVCGIWAEVLGVSRDAIGAGDSFFEMGGHSILGTQVVSRLREALRVELPVRVLFEAPTVEALASRVARALESGEGGHPPKIRPVPRQGPQPLSFAQERLWFLQQLEPDSVAYNLPIAVRLKGPLDVARLARSLSEIVRRHETLRTTFAVLDGQPVQVISPARAVELPVVDLGVLPVPRREAAALRLAAEDARRPFDLRAGPLLRAILVRLDAGEHLALVVLHHIVTDAWSMGLLVRELVALYSALCRREPWSLPEPPVQYADYSAWQRRWLGGEALERQIAYWKQRLAGAPQQLELPSDRPRSAAPAQRGGRALRQLARVPAGELESLARSRGATLFMVLLAGFEALVSRLTGQQDFLLGTDVANRTRQEIEGVIGFFVNQLTLRADLAGDPTFHELLARVRETTLSAYDNAEVPFEQVVERVRPQRSLGRSPLFQVKLNQPNVPEASLDLPDLTCDVWQVEAGEAKLDLILDVVKRGDALVASCNYNAELFDSASVDRLLARFEDVLAEAAARPDARVSELCAGLARVEREEWRARRAAARSERWPRDNAVKGGFMKQSEGHPSWSSRRSAARPQGVALSSESLVEEEALIEGKTLPLLLRPAMSQVDLASWLASKYEHLQERLREAGGILFRGFGLKEQADFERALQGMPVELMSYMEGATPRTKLSAQVYTSTEFPPEQTIALHNELSYVMTWPLKIWFYCVQPAARGGETPLADVRRVYRRIDPSIRERFEEKGWLLVRNFGWGFGPSWQSAYRTDDRLALEEYLRRADIEFEWEGEHLRTRQRRPATATHPYTGEPLWFNHVAFWHVSSLEPELRNLLLRELGMERLPYSTWYGDGTPIEDEVAAALRRAYDEETVAFPWQTGDLLMLDNMLVAHGRRPFEGPRRILTAMGEPCSRRGDEIVAEAAS